MKPRLRAQRETMASLRRAAHLVAEGFQGFLIAPGQVLASLVGLAVASCLVTLFIAYGSLAVRVLEKASSRGSVLVYLQNEISSEKVEAVITQLKQRLEVAQVRYFSAGEDRARNAALLPEDLRASVPWDSIPGQHGLEVTLLHEPNTALDLQGLKAFAAQLDGVDVVAGPPVGAERLRALAAASTFVKTGLVVFSVLLLLSTAFLVVGSLTRTMERRREEMALLSILGATSAYLKAPLYLQGVLQGAIGIFGGVIAGIVTLKITEGWLRESVGIAARLAPSWDSAALVALGCGGLVGLVASVFATMRRPG